jgi:esterase/lipase
VSQPIQKLKNINRLFVNDIEVIYSRQAHENAIIYLHGFPGPYELLPSGTLRVADQLFDFLSSKYDFYYPLYTIKHSFSLLNTLTDCAKILEEIRRRKTYKTISLVGQSWGAVIALHLSSLHNFEQLFLITPFISIPKGEAALKLVQLFSHQYPGLIPPTSIEKIVQELATITELHLPEENLKKTGCNTIIFAAENDEIIKLSAIKDIAVVNEKVKLIVLPRQSHNIENRDEFRSVFINEIN